MKKLSLIATSVALLAFLGASCGWVLSVHDSNLLVTSALFVPMIVGMIMGFINYRRGLFKTSLIYSLINFVFAGLAFYVIFTV